MNARKLLFVALIAAALPFAGCKKCCKKTIKQQEVAETVLGSRSVEVEKENLAV